MSATAEDEAVCVRFVQNEFVYPDDADSDNGQQPKRHYIDFKSIANRNRGSAAGCAIGIGQRMC